MKINTMSSIASGITIVASLTVVFFLFTPVLSQNALESSPQIVEAFGSSESGGCCSGGGGGGGSDRDNDRDKPKPKPSCVISANPNSIQNGGSSSLSWTSKNSSSASLSVVGSVGTSGSFTVFPSGTTTYTLTVKGSGGTATCKTTVVVQTPTPSCAISANPNSLQHGGSSTLTWSSNNATSASINQGIGGVALAGSNVVSNLTSTKTYTMTVTGPGGTANCQTTITVQQQQAPSCTLTTNLSTIQYGGSFTLSWSSSNATSASLNQGIGSVGVNGTYVVSNLQVTTTYTLTVTGPGGTANCQTFVTVQQQPDAPSCTISANPNSVQHGGSSTLNWSSLNATSATLSSYGSVSLNGSQTVNNITSNSTYTLTVTGPGGTANCQTTITVQQQQTPSCSISANPSSVQTGGSSYLTWSSSNATSANLSNFGSVGTNGNQTVYPSGTTTYTLTVYGSQGQSAQCQTTVNVNTIPYQNPPSCWITLSNYGYGGSYQYNQPVTLSWGSNNATNAYISPLIGSVQTYGSRTVYTDGYVMYTMTVHNAQGQSATCQTQAQVIPPPPVYPPQVTLTQIPYTGLDLGTVGTIAYYFSILAFVLAATYLAVYYLPMFAGVKARVPVRAMEAPMQFAKSVAASIPIRMPSSTKLALGSLTKDAMAFMRSENGSAPRIVITRG